MLTLLGVQTAEGQEGRRSRELERLLLQVGKDDRDAFAQFYERTRAAVYALALSLLHDAHEVRAVAQDVSVKGGEDAPAYRCLL